MERRHDYYTIDFTGMKDWRDIYPKIKKSMDFPDYFGENLDALWDCLTDCFCHQNTIIIKGICSLSKTMQGYLTKICETFEEAQEKYPEDFKIRYVD